MEYQYGNRSGEVDEFFRQKRAWSNVKDKIVGDYVSCYLKTVPNLRKPILIIDGFSGPGRFGDGTDGSPIIFCSAIEQITLGRAVTSCLFADANPTHRLALSENLAPYIAAGIAESPFDDWKSALTRALEVGAASTMFFYLDPYGIKELEFDAVRQIYERDTRRSTEVLINFNFRTFMRMSGNWNYADGANEISEKVKASKVETVNRVMGGDYWIPIVTDRGLNKLEREDAVINAYLERVKKYFPFGYSIPVKERRPEDAGVPDDDLARYHLIFATRSSRAVQYMNDIALNALEPYLKQFSDGLLFDMTPDRYKPVDRNSVKAAIVECVREHARKRPEIYEVIIPQFFMQYRKKEYRAMIDELIKEHRLLPIASTLNARKQVNDHTVFSVTPPTISIAQSAR
ncbi:MAG TPA: three-Cys-motif partner protein TcmP [Usitatibacter sp.]|jgi:three-Cys-motif partner protein|nr:three-Cys-motif partner protein TcmP [Usitatibacter sp.]